MKVAVGSKNPVKIEAVRKAFQKVFGECKVEGFSVSSGVSDMPMTVEETIKGAKTRAQTAIDKSKFDFGVGLEGGFDKTQIGTFIVSVVAIINKNGIWGIGRGGGILMPEMIIKKVEEGKELSLVMDELLGTKNINHHEGTTGYFTKNIIDRTQSFENTTVIALARFIRPELYR